MNVENTKDRTKVENIRKWSIQQVALNEYTEVKNWDNNSPWHNSKFTDSNSELEWVIYLADQAWSGEVKILKCGKAT